MRFAILVCAFLALTSGAFAADSVAQKTTANRMVVGAKGDLGHGWASMEKQPDKQHRHTSYRMVVGAKGDLGGGWASKTKQTGNDTHGGPSNKVIPAHTASTAAATKPANVSNAKTRSGSSNK